MQIQSKTKAKWSERSREDEMGAEQRESKAQAADEKMSKGSDARHKGVEVHSPKLQSFVHKRIQDTLAGTLAKSALI